MCERHSERGQILIMTALMMVALLGTAALSIDASYMFDRRNILYAAADDAAKSGAIERWRSGSADVSAFAMNAIGAQLNVDPSTISPAPIVRACNDPAATCNAKFAGSSTYIEVILGQDTSTFFGRVIGWNLLRPTARAVAGTSNSINCLITLSPPSGNFTIAHSGTSSITATNCGIGVGGTLDSAIPLNAASVSAVACSNNCTGVNSPSAPPTDPLANLPTPTAADCNNGNPGTDINVDVTGAILTAGTYHDIHFIAGNGSNSTLTLGPGVYCITGLVSVKNAGSNVNITDTGGVLVYISPTGTFDLGSNQVSVTLQAQTSGPWSGVFFYQDRTNANPITMTKNHGPWLVDGAFYAPAAVVDAKNANWASSNFCGLFVVGEIDFDQPNLTFDNSCSSFSGSPLTTVTLAE
jgi:hypothetical protein